MSGVAEVSPKYLAETASVAIPAGYKQTEVGVVPEDWDVCELQDAVNFLDGLRRPVKSGDRAKISGIYPYYGASGIVDYVNDYIFDDELILLGEDGENILSRNLPLAFKVSGKIWVNNHAHVMKPNEYFDITYLTEFLESLDYSLLNSGTAQPKLNKQACLRIKVAKPPRNEQTAIANALSDVDALISELEKLIAKKQAIKTATMQQLLTGHTRLPQFALREDGTPKRTKPSELGEIPEDWEVHSLSSICDVRDGTHDSPKYKDNGIPLVTSKNIVDDILDLSNVSLISPEDAFEIDKRSKVDKGDIIMSMIGTVGSAVLLLEEPKFCIKNVALFKPKKVSGEFLVQLIRSKIFQDYLEDSMDGGIQKFVSLGTLRNMEISLPSEREQAAIATILSDMDEEIQALEQRLGKTRQIKQGMMQELLTGKTRLIKPSKEVIHE
ncbi:MULTISPECIES: restriction endonuclease subunit S [Vibrio]|uniref:Type I restriction modification DNA specificity domain-containing protein n=1 Tax=Vibrio navarrensis TaxID=29495 RepID=A0A099LPE9_9VIBR|nr:restriction endonuclease subunit S [Vibrio navarrensis]KGK10103.1 hypothetical protein EA26_01760 [Vibrio navarrensis]